MGRAAVLVVAVLGAYWVSLATLWRDLSGQTPLAFIGLAPILGLGLLVAGLQRREPLPPPGRVDLIVGLLLIAGAAAVVFIAPYAASVYFWVARLDILSMPLFVAGALLLLFGWRVLFVSRGALFLVLLAWPLPYAVLIENSSELLTSVTADAVTLLTAVLPIASVVPGREATFLVAYAAAPFQVQVATACAGLNSTVAFVLVGGAIALLLNGRLLAKIAWLGLGVLVIFCLNVVRVIGIIAVGAAFGQSAALDMFHPVAGMLTLFVGVLLMLGLTPLFGLTIPRLRPASQPVSAAHRTDVAGPSPRHGLAARGAVLAMLALVFASANASFASYEQDPNALIARPLPISTQVASRAVLGSTTIEIGKPYYGADSTWIRYRLARDTTAAGQGGPRVWLDDIRVTDRQRLVDFNVEKCYRFHDMPIEAAQSLVLGYGVVGRIVQTRFSSRGVQWLVLWWELPIRVGDQVHHERVALLAPAVVEQTGRSASAGEPARPIFDFGTAVAPQFRPMADEMASLAREVVATQFTSRVAAR